jgi:hypothetical protein
MKQQRLARNKRTTVKKFFGIRYLMAIDFRHSLELLSQPTHWGASETIHYG